YYHSNHFICTNCSGDLRNGAVYVESGLKYDSVCYFELFVPKCAHCGEPVSGQYVESDSNTYHAHCFENHVGFRCGVCGEVIYGHYIIDGRGNTVHSTHKDKLPNCDYCGSFITQNLTGGSQTYEDGRTVCGLCVKTAINDIDEARQLMAEIIVSMAARGINIDEKKIPLELVDLPRMKQKMSGNYDDPSGFTTYKRESVIPGIWSVRDFNIYVLHGMPRAQCAFTLAHELMHVWLFKNAPSDISHILTEGSCQYAASLMLLGLDDPEAGMVWRKTKEDPDPIYGEGLRNVDAYVQRVGIDGWLEYLKGHTDPPW
ncbi:MAG: protein DA1, partial [Candidatus Zixiibacteriota bacterium]